MINSPPIVGVPAFARCVCGPSCRMTWPIWNSRSRRIRIGPTHEADRQRRHARARRAERDVTEHVEHRHRRVQRIQKVVQHQAYSTFRRSTTTSVRMPRDPLTSTRSPGRTFVSARSAASALVDDVRRTTPPACRRAARRRPGRAPASPPTAISRSSPAAAAARPHVGVEPRGVLAELEHLAEHRPPCGRCRWRPSRSRALAAAPPGSSCRNRRSA